MVYLIHFDRPIGTERQKAQHYLGSCKDLDGRMAEHRSGNGAAIMAEVTRQGIDWNVVKTWDGGRKLERQLKNQKHAWRHCPICRQARGMKNGTHD